MAVGKNEWFTSGEAAQYLHLSVDTINDLADRGVLRCTRTEGGHRRFRRSTLEAYRWDQLGSPAPRRQPTRARVSAPPPEEPIIPAEGYYYDPERGDVFPLPKQPLSPPDPAVERVPELKRYGLTQIPWGVPDSEKAKVVQTLERYVTSANLPSWIPDFEARNLVKAQVQEALKAYHAGIARREQELVDEMKVSRLIDAGKSDALWKTINWDADDREPARREVERHLRKVVEADWSEDDVKDEVSKVLADWEDDDYDDDDEDDEDLDDEEDDPGDK
ncbi:MAG TPA: excisionase family DNA-binding protein [Trebonia sp.]|nr:excisionase family DNA-binding protein [Trebonia sp.]